jgi:putative tryptophan/tyrosine transport system substrate-binding protein
MLANPVYCHAGERQQQMQFDRLNRREAITLLGGAAMWPVAARAQQRPMPVIGFMHTLSPEIVAEYVAAFHRGLGQAGYVEGRNAAVEYRWAQGHYDRLPELAADLVRRKINVLAAMGGDPSRKSPRPPRKRFRSCSR